MRVFIIDTTHMSPELQGGLIGIVGSEQPSPEEKQQCVDTGSHYATDGWAIAEPHTPIGRLAAITVEAARVPFVNISRLQHYRTRDVGAQADNRLINSGGVGHGIG